MDADKLAKLKASMASSRIGGKGTPRRKVKRVVKGEGNDQKVQAALAKLNPQTITGIEQVNMFKDDNRVIHISRPAVQNAPDYNTFAIHGYATEKSVEEMLPEMIQSMGPESLEQLRKLTEQIQAAQGANAGANKEAEDSEVPNLVEGETFDREVD
ncbi:Nascent polypeptide-associated complex subunit beta [Wickerhamiella sorbophila]|uniref:Nascent polypeptide-associated complex subunit beta n=1 Tax=Wickerhamiella sorbophila TaxID=45607 RepID=A0A2T0FLA9_9ASCO|nr:Nascent polypeptide-associated complex subunit beta [Wickerhamiella sorbophila]PRT55760.1 Nascent polypeptide-associated complex subunit beta [Wickerhamiella sorbophila]